MTTDITQRWSRLSSEAWNNFSEFWTRKKISLKITEPNLPTTDNHFWENLITFQTVAIFVFMAQNFRPIAEDPIITNRVL